ncbi:MAG: GNAT family N-acetyltransferase [Thermoleophilaceae bacterium]|nr:GNAT family N-acetyltransferase [Thermoleophilaceae bacterium]
MRLVPCAPEHYERLRELHVLPEVRRWWHDPSEEWPDDEEDSVNYTMLLDGRIAGFIQWWSEDDPMYRHAGYDLFVDPELHSRGLGTEAGRALCAHLIDDHGFHRLVIDPGADNAVAIASYTKLGFRPVGVLRRYERALEGGWRDGLLMDLLAEDFVR